MELRGAATLFLAACISCLIFLWKRKQKQQTSKLPPGPTPLPLLGNVLQLSRTHLFKSLVTLGEKYGPVFTVYLGSRRVVVLCGHEAVKQALVDHGEVFGGRGRMPTLDRIFHGYGVIFANGERWKQLRQFSIMTLRNFGMGKRSLEERITEEAQCLVEEIRKTKGSPFDPSHPIGHAIASVLSAITFGQRFDYQDEKFAHIIDAIQDLFLELSTPWTQEKQNPQSEFHTKNLVLSAVHLFFGGTEMVSSTLRYGFLLLMKYTEIQGKVQEEIDHVIGKNRSPATEDRSQMPYTHAVIHEIQRFSNIIPLGIPHAVIQDTQFRGYTLPKGTDVFCLLGSALQDPQHFINPEDFDPRNFLDENGSFKKNNAFVAFSSGKRMCLGEGLARMELFLVFTSVLQHFTLKSPINPQEIDLTPKASGFWHVSPRYKLCAHPR
ncbi:cytochrome P450 2G1-like isoform X7 [Emydura macquarii macquarii]|uniref:cytochrome P450 2G1-like isoform X7 n=1 Tax=Emydura macquarii macquarii TaxID=1129001 RepID=UPI00352AB1D5